MSTGRRERKQRRKVRQLRERLTEDIRRNDLRDFKEVVGILANREQVDVFGSSVDSDSKSQTAVAEVAYAQLEEKTRYAMLETLVTAKADVNLADSGWHIPIHSPQLTLSTLRLLLTAKANVNVLCEDGVTPLHDSVYGDNIEKCKVLLEAKANVNMRGHHNSSVLDVLNPSNLELRQLLLDAGADLPMIHRHAEHAIRLCRLSEFQVYLNEIIKRGKINEVVQTDPRLDYPVTLLDRTATVRTGYITEKVQMLKLLLAARADPNVECPHQDRMMFDQRIFPNEKHLPVFETLISGQFGIPPNLNTLNHAGLTLLQVLLNDSCFLGCKVVINTVLRNLPRVTDLDELASQIRLHLNAVSSKGVTLLTYLAQHGEVDLTRQLLEAKADPNLIGSRETPLSFEFVSGRDYKAVEQCRDLIRVQLTSLLHAALSFVLTRDPSGIVIGYITG